MNSSLARLSTLLALVPSLALATEKPVGKAGVPKVVLQTAKTSYPNGKVIESVMDNEGTRKIYEVRLQDGAARVDLKIDASGKLVAQEHLVDLKAVPVAVINGALAPPYQDWKVQRVEKVDNLETPAQSGYEVLIEQAGTKRELLLTAVGALLKQEDDDKQEDAVDHK